MKLKDTNWTAVFFRDRTILKSDMIYMNWQQKEALLSLEVEKISGKRQHKSERYKVIKVEQ